MLPKELKNEKQKIMWESSRSGVILFCVFHLLFEILITGNRFSLIAVIINYSITSVYIKWRISEGKEFKNLFLMGVLVSFVVFMLIIFMIVIYTFSK